MKFASRPCGKALLTAGLILAPCALQAQGTAFSYQGRLNSGGQPANGGFDMAFALYNAATNGTRIGAAVTNLATGVTNGLFTVTLDFSSAPLNGQPLWIQIAVSPAGANSFTTLSPLQPLTSIPYAVQSLNAGTAANVTGPIALWQLPGTVLTNGATNASITGTFTGNGAGLTNVSLQPLTIAGTTAQAAPNTSYVVTNDMLTTVGLPTNANVGDIIRITGTGAGGWLAIGDIDGTIYLPETGWTLTSAPAEIWQSVASSSDGTHLVAAVGFNEGGIYTSTNSGLTWAQTSAPAEEWKSVASSPDGNHLVAVNSSTSDGSIYTSVDGGATWALTSAPSNNWNSVASSSGGTYLVAVVNHGGIYISIDSGATWTQTSAPSNSWTSVASSSDGTHLVALAGSGGIYTSINRGATWSQSSVPTRDWFSVASSFNGTHLVAAAIGNGIYISTDSGATWARTSAPTLVWRSVASSSDGTRLAGVTFGGGVYTSIDGGTTWALTTAPFENWNSVASSSDGSQLVAVFQNGGIYVNGLQRLPQVAGASQEFQYAGNGEWKTVTMTFPANPTFSGTVAADSFSGDGSGLTNINIVAANLSGTILQTNLGATNSFIPTIGNGASNFITTTDVGYYAKTGNLVYFEIIVTWTSTSGVNSGTLKVSLPFTVQSERPAFNIGLASGISVPGQLTATASAGASALTFLSNPNNGSAPVNVTIANCSNSGQVQITGTYRWQ